MTYRLNVFTDSVPEAIRHAGGLMFDRRRAGWDVVVSTEDCRFARALAILGVRLLDPSSPDDQEPGSPWDICTVVARAATCVRDSSETTRFLDQDFLWWSPGDVEESSPVRTVRHELSSAAQAFKRQALRCAGCLAGPEPYEVFRTADLVGADLVVVEKSPEGQHARSHPRCSVVVGR